jgi:hypothetical protein
MAWFGLFDPNDARYLKSAVTVQDTVQPVRDLTELHAVFPSVM